MDQKKSHVWALPATISVSSLKYIYIYKRENDKSFLRLLHPCRVPSMFTVSPTCCLLVGLEVAHLVTVETIHDTEFHYMNVTGLQT